jgi:hypothetical protein
MVRFKKLLLQDGINEFTRCLVGQLCRAILLARERGFVGVEEAGLGEVRTGACIWALCLGVTCVRLQRSLFDVEFNSSNSCN